MPAAKGHLGTRPAAARRLAAFEKAAPSMLKRYHAPVRRAIGGASRAKNPAFRGAPRSASHEPWEPSIVRPDGELLSSQPVPTTRAVQAYDYRSNSFLSAHTVAALPARAIDRVRGIDFGHTATQFCALPHI